MAAENAADGASIWGGDAPRRTDIERLTERVALLHGIAQTILLAGSLRDLAVRILAPIGRLIAWDYVAIVYCEPAHDAVTMLHQALSPALHAWPAATWPAAAGAPWRDHPHRPLLTLDDIAAAQEPSPALAMLGAAGLRSLLAVSLQAGGELTGGIVLAATTPNAFSAEHVTIMRELADLLAVGFQNVRLRLELQQERERQQALAHRLLETQESERRHLARELHDEVGQILTITKIYLQTIQRKPGAAAFDTALRESIGMVESALQQVRNLSLALRPSLLDDLGLAAAIRWYVNRQAELVGLTAHVQADCEDDDRPPAAVETACFRIVQEAVNNVVRHAQASSVWISLQQTPNLLQVMVRDDGLGFDVGAANRLAVGGHSMGLLSMQERALLAGGRLFLESAPQAGTLVRAEFPHGARPRSSPVPPIPPISD